jgi:hypothetical protein
MMGDEATNISNLGVRKWVDGAIDVKPAAKKPIVSGQKMFITDLDKNRIIVIQVIPMDDLKTLGHDGNLDRIKRFFLKLGYKMVKRDSRERTAEVLMDIILDKVG